MLIKEAVGCEGRRDLAEGEIRIALFKPGEQKETNSLWKMERKQGKMNRHLDAKGYIKEPEQPRQSI